MVEAGGRYITYGTCSRQQTVRYNQTAQQVQNDALYRPVRLTWADSLDLLTGRRDTCRAQTAAVGAPPQMGTCPSAQTAVEGGSLGDDDDTPAAPAYGKGPGMKRGASGRKGLTKRGTNEKEDLGEDEGEPKATRRALMSGVQRWCLDVSEWGELSTEQASERDAEEETARQGLLHRAAAG